jgi:hypothetical protein
MRICLFESIALVTLASACYGQGTISSFGGTLYSNCSQADGVQATTACLSAGGIVLDKQGNLYYADGRYAKVRKITPSGVVSTLAGTTQAIAETAGRPPARNSCCPAAARLLRALLSTPPGISMSATRGTT